MPILVNANQLSKAFGARPLFDGLAFSIDAGERIGLIGPNGAGKSTLLRILAGKESPDSGVISFQRGLKTAYLAQVPQFQPGATVHATVADGVAGDDWERMADVDELISRLSLGDPSAKMESLSGGWKKKVALAKALAKRPDLLLLDEPTNHLDVESILWLEDLLASARFATITVTHDRRFLQRVSSRILELDPRNPGGILSVRGDYADYLAAKENLVQTQEQREVVLKNTLRRETEWLRQGAKARTTKQQARIHRAEALGKEVAELETRNRARVAGIEFEDSDRKPKRLLEARGISKAFSGKAILGEVSLILGPRTRLGVLGPNGCGKSTLIRVLTGEEKADRGEVLRAEQLQVAYFEQNRETLDPACTLLRTICPSGDHVDFRGTRVHVRSYLDRFLFSTSQAEMAVGKLSGGEQSRILLALLMLRPANLLILDEPTNDLDLVTLNVLEECLLEFEGAVLLVTHDRAFMDRVANRILAFHPWKSGSRLTEFADMSQWESWHRREAVRARAPVNEEAQASVKAVPRKLGFNEQRELDSMEARILEAEAELAKELGRIERLSGDPVALRAATQSAAEAQVLIEALYLRWSELTSR